MSAGVVARRLGDVGTIAINGDAVSGIQAGTPEPFLVTNSDERAPAFSPDAKWLAYTSNESGTNEVYVRAFPDNGSKWQISTGGGNYPRLTRTVRYSGAPRCLSSAMVFALSPAEVSSRK
jgi:hypothetical protein